MGSGEKKIKKTTQNFIVVPFKKKKGDRGDFFFLSKFVLVVVGQEKRIEVFGVPFQLLLWAISPPVSLVFFVLFCFVFCFFLVGLDNGKTITKEGAIALVFLNEYSNSCLKTGLIWPLDGTKPETNSKKKKKRSFPRKDGSLEEEMKKGE